MKTTLPLMQLQDCWNQIGIRGDRSCPELVQQVHCHNCPTFARAGRRFLEANSPPDYLDEWTKRLAAPVQEDHSDLLGVLVFRLGDEWLALPVETIVEVTTPKVVRRVPHRGGLLAGVVNFRGELHLCVRLDTLLGVQGIAHDSNRARMIVTRHDHQSWVFSVDEVDQVQRLPVQHVTKSPATVSRASARLSRGIFHAKELSIGLLEPTRLFEALRERMR